MNWRWQEFLSLFLASPCPLCQRSAPRHFCPGCERQVRHCELPLSQCHQEWRGALPLFVWGQYQDALRQAIAALKYEKRPGLGLLLGQWMAQSWQHTQNQRGTPPRQLTVVPIPLHASKLKQRGFNQADLLAQGFCRHTRLPLMSNGLVRVRATEAQFSLSKEDRRQNLDAAFEVNPALGHRPVLLLDDIFTTGATAYSAQAALQASQVPVYGIIALARAGGREYRGKSR